MKADLSVYEGKRAIRSVLGRLPGLQRLEPNAVTVSILVPAVLAGVSLWYGWWAFAAVGLPDGFHLAAAEIYARTADSGGSADENALAHILAALSATASQP